MPDPTPPSDPFPFLHLPAGRDRYGEQRGLEVSNILFKVTPQDSRDTLILENVFRAPGGPAKHLHHQQDEWFYILEGEFRFEVGDQRLTLNPGDSLLGPRRVPHVWAFTGKGSPTGRILIAFLPAGQMEAFFRENMKANEMPPLRPALWRAHGMELLGQPLKV
jgi:quercetin dioxygenase-like cupin family protein